MKCSPDIDRDGVALWNGSHQQIGVHFPTSVLYQSDPRRKEDHYVMATNRFLAPSGRLRFESNVARPQISGRAVRTFLAGVCAILLSIGVGWMAPGLFNTLLHRNGDKALAHLAATVTEALRTGSLDAAVALTVDDKTARERISQTADPNQNTVLAGTVSETKKETPDTCRTFLASMRSEMARQGLAWDRVRPLGFGGLLASVSASDKRGHDTAKSALGDIYFSCDNVVYALELTARQCGNTYVIMDFWRCTPIETTPENLKRYALSRFQSLTQESNTQSLPLDVEQVRYTYVPAATK